VQLPTLLTISLVLAVGLWPTRVLSGQAAARVDITPKDVTLPAGKCQQFLAWAYDEAGKRVMSASFRYSLSNAEDFTLRARENGLVCSKATLAGGGTTQVTVTVDGTRAKVTTTFTVPPAPPPASGDMTISPSDAPASPGDMTIAPSGGAAPQGLSSEATANSIKIRWTCTAGATGYEVYAMRRGGSQTKLTPTAIGPQCMQDPSAVVGARMDPRLPAPDNQALRSSFTHSNLAAGDEYTYVVRALYAAGFADSDPLTASTTRAPGPMPTNLTAAVVGDYTVELRWVAAPGATGYSVVREDLRLARTAAGIDPAAGVARITELTPNACVTPTGFTDRVPGAGTYRYHVTACPAGGTTTTPIDVPPRRTMVRLTINGFKADHETFDHQLEVDGKGDEVFVTAIVGEINAPTNRTFPLLKTTVYGDVNGFPDRIKAGTRSSQGGIQTGDAYPATPWNREGGASADRLPLLLWCGTLKEGGNRVIIVPTIWEYDGETKQLSKFVDEMNRVVLSPEFLYAAATAYSTAYVIASTAGSVSMTYTLASAGNFAVLAFAALNLAALIEKANVFGNAEDRPIGLKVEDGSIQPNSLILGYETASAHLGTSVGGKPPGIIPIRYTDRGELGDYEMYVQVEAATTCSPR